MVRLTQINIIDHKSAVDGNHVSAFGANSEATFEPEGKNNSVNDLMGGFSMNEDPSNSKQKRITPEIPEYLFADLNTHSSHQASNDALSGILGSQATGMNANPMFPLGTMSYAIPPGVMLNPAFSSQPFIQLFRNVQLLIGIWRWNLVEQFMKPGFSTSL